nr:hypothetical protein [Tanacetum cinerariifolium]
MEHVIDEAIHKKLGASFVRVATTASSLEAEQDSGNINKTQSKATPNKSSSQRTSLGGGSRCQEAMGIPLLKLGYTLKQLKEFEFDKVQEMFDKDFKRVNTSEDFRSELVQRQEKEKRAKKQKVEDDKETAELKQLMEIIPDKEEVAIDAIPLAVKSPGIVDWKIYKEGMKSYYQIIRANGKLKTYIFFCQMLTSFDWEDLEDMYKLVKAKYRSTRPVEDLDLRIVKIKSLFDAVGITAAHVCVNTAQLELVLDVFQKL